MASAAIKHTHQSPDTADAMATQDRSPAMPFKATQAEHSGLRRLLAFEDRIRACETRLELEHTLANELRGLVGARQVIVLHRKTLSKWRLSCISSMPNRERDAPLVRAIEHFVCAQAATADPETASLCYLDAIATENQDLISAYPFREAIWLPIRFRSGEIFAGLLLLHEKPWNASSCELLQRQAPMISDTWCAIAGRRSLRPSTGRRRALGLVACSLALACMALPVSMTTLAPIEIVARDPVLVTAPIDGVIDVIHASPNRKVIAGQPLLSFIDTELRNAFELAQREADVATSRYSQLSQAAFTDEKSRHELGIAKTEMKLRLAQRDYAKERLDLIVVRADRDGLLIYQDKSRLLGRPVAVGERLMRIAQPGKVYGEISLPVADAIALTRGGQARFFLDANPTRSLTAKVETESYHAEPDATGALVYSVRAALDADQPVPRIGSRGTAQLFGGDVPLGFFLFRRPISWVRQKFGL